MIQSAATSSRPETAALGFRVLGTVELIRHGVPCTPTALKQRALLALFLLHANQYVATTRIIDDLWGGEPPPAAVAAVQMYISALRRVLQPAKGFAVSRRHPVLHTYPAGYLLQVENGQLDLAECRALAEQAKAHVDDGECDRAEEPLQRALRLWRGPALADLRHVGKLESYAVRLDEERLALLHERIRVSLCQGRCHDVIGELEELCARQPLREDFHQQLMIALHQAGRRAEALDVYRRVRRVLDSEVGIAPGVTLRATQQAILTGAEPPNGRHARHRARPA